MVGSTHWTNFWTIATTFSLTRESMSWPTFDIIQVWLFDHSLYVLSKSSSRLPCKWYYPNLNVQSYSCVHLNILCIYFWCSWNLFCSNWKKNIFQCLCFINWFIHLLYVLALFFHLWQNFFKAKVAYFFSPPITSYHKVFQLSKILVSKVPAIRLKKFFSKEDAQNLTLAVTILNLYLTSFHPTQNWQEAEKPATDLVIHCSANLCVLFVILTLDWGLTD